MRDDPDEAWSGGRERVVHAREQEAVQVDEVPGDVEGGDLPAPVGEQPVAVDEALQQDVAVLGRAALAHDVLARCDLPGLRDARRRASRSSSETWPRASS